MSEVAIQARGLTKRFGKFTAVDQINLDIPYGTIFGYLGANGAGKSTTIKMLCGILAPSAGTATVAGFDIDRDTAKIKQAIGYVSQAFSLYADLTVLENLRFFGEIYGLHGAALNSRIEDVLQMTGLKSADTKLAMHLSGGMKQKLAIANGILHKPRILFLDEPTAGIDPLSRRAIWDVLLRLSNEGVALFLTTHYMEEAERCQIIAFVSAGQILKVGPPADFKQIAPNLEEAFVLLETRRAAHA